MSDRPSAASTDLTSYRDRFPILEHTTYLINHSLGAMPAAAEELEAVALAELERRHPERPLKTNVEYYSAIVLDVAEIPPPLAPAMFACSRVAGWSAHILEQKRTGRLFRPSARYVGPAERQLN